MVKLKDLAESTGYSINTVSRALRGDTRISAAARALITEKAHEMGYIPNMVAGSMRSNRSHTIGVVSADSANPFFAEVIVGIEEAARKQNYSILLINTEEQTENERAAVKLLLGRKVDGLLGFPSLSGGKQPSVFHSLKIPFLLVGRYLPGLEDHSILHGDAEGQRQVFEDLLDRGHRKILYLAGPDFISNTHDRIKGLEDAYRSRDLKWDESYTITTSGHIEDGYAQINQALHRGIDFTAVACFNDLLAMGVLKSLYENGRNVPGDTEVFGYDNLYMSQFMQPRLSTVDVPKNILGKTALEELVLHIEDPERKYETVNLKPRLIYRETTVQKKIDPEAKGS
ncbi:LacI family DNA-binding transcriptional regulator [Breznakiella homolactica]|uniref:LacI family DNA-binding transcriptional regulator n=1 Tax=Breznakiella homolactica TaxID=2798577 RepID=A0A7T7XMH8_9SPIR|nr:LacI family DNA-binding transcriptional regulator [Breznakiella homolactica]QQO09070.1 LacI family transcriptional regulator [Breznakiella homolactica]